MKANISHDEQPLNELPVNMQEHRTFLTIPELAKYLRISASTIRNRMREGSLPRKKVFGRVLFDLEEVNKWVAEQSELDGLIRKATVFEKNPRIGRRSPPQPVVFTME